MQAKVNKAKQQNNVIFYDDCEVVDGVEVLVGPQITETPVRLQTHRP